MENLFSIGGFLKINENDSLASLQALDSIHSNTVTLLFIEKNPLLSTCEEFSICSYLQSQKPRTIRGNAPGCRSIMEVISVCQATAVDNPNNNHHEIEVFPNPSEGMIIIQSDQSELLKYRIYSPAGQIMKAGQVHSREQFDFSSLPEGMYYIEIIAGNEVMTKKIMMLTEK